MRALIFAAVLLIASTARATVEDYYTLVDSAEFYIGAHEWARAEEFIQKALRNEPDNQNTSLLLSNLATVQRYQGKNREALKNYNVALFMTPNSVTLLKNRASLFLDMDSTERAYADYNRVLEIDGYDIVLEDKELNKRVVLDSKTTYMFNASSVDNANRFVVYLQSETTSIGSVNKTEEIENSEGIYTISGVRVSEPLSKGIYIQNGKKIIIK